MNKSKLLAASSMLAISSVAATAAFAQGADIEQVVVSASRISIAGYQQPTPVSVVGAAALAAAANADIGDTLRQMPSMGTSPTPEKGTNGNASNSGALGLSGVNLRNLGVNRNLVLLDGQRVVSAIATGGVDLSIIPSTLLQRVDVVTAGASAAWGSDAVSGVINLIINKSFTGFKASVDAQDNEYDNRRSYGFTATGGFDFDGGRAHVVGAVTYNNSPETVFQNSANWFQRPCVLANPAYTAGNKSLPQNLHYNNCGQNTVAGGAVLSGPLVGLGFGPGGAPYRFIPGNNTYYNNAGSFLTSTADSVGGTPQQSTSAAQIGLLSFPLQQGTAFGYASYKITPDIQAGLMLNYGYDRAHSSSLTINASGTIKTDNAYLDPTVQARMLALGLTSFAVQSNFTDGINLSNPGNLSNFYKTVGAPVAQSVRQMYRGVFTLDGALGDDWSWAASYQHSESHLHEVDTHIEIVGNLANAVDAVRVTTANVGASGAQVGSIVCRSSLTNPTNGCVPLNIMGTGVQSQGAVDYINDNNDWTFVNLQQDSAGASMQGKLPWDLLGAGAPSIAFGAEYRKEAIVATAAYNPTNILLGGGNFQPSRGEYNVEEGFAELDVPLIKNGIVQDLSASLAGRYTSYSISGAVQTWKLGLSSQVNDDVRLRTTWSYDIRAPNLGELFGSVPASGGTIDPKTNATVSSALTDVYFNQNLQPEKSTTISGGVVLTPHWVPGLTMSFDWYSINVKGIIATPSSTITLNFCKQGIAAYCNNYQYTAAVSASNPFGLNVVLLVPANNGFLTTSGLDFQADYTMDLFAGTLGLHLLGNYTDEETESVFGGAQFDLAGSMGGDSVFTGGVPKMHFNLGATYDQGPWSGTVQARYIGTARVNNNWTSGVQIDNNAVPAVAYMDLRGSYKWNDNIQFYGAVDDVWDTPPPTTVGTNPSTNGGSSTNVSVYDTLGRMYHAGVRFNF
jgi:outer membrane receptor protein involved in Fe transport